MKYRILYEITPLAGKDSAYPEGLALINKKTNAISNRAFGCYDHAVDFLLGKCGFDQGTGFWVRETNKKYITATIIPEIGPPPYP